jgi:DNA-directed RNA polymerase subunit E"
MPRKLKACKKCHSIVEGDGKCPICNTNTDLSPNFSGLVMILDVENSEIAKRMNITQAGAYAIKVRN